MDAFLSTIWSVMGPEVTLPSVLNKSGLSGRY